MATQMNAIEQIRETLEEALQSLPEEEKELAKDVGEDLAEVTMKAAKGEDMSSEILHLKSQVTSLSLAVKTRVMSVVFNTFGDIVGRVVVQVFEIDDPPDG